MVSDLLFNYDSFHGAYLHSRVEGAAPVYQYRSVIWYYIVVTKHLMSGGWDLVFIAYQV